MNSKLLVLIYLIYTVFYLFEYFVLPQIVNHNKVRVVFFDVGQGDSILVVGPKGFHAVIDGGPNYDLDFQIQAYISPLFCSIDLAVLTHAHADHSVGLARLLRRCSSKNLVDGSKTIQNRGVVRLPVSSEYEFVFLAPGKSLYDGKNQNLISIITALKVKSSVLLLGGDAEKPVWGSFDRELRQILNAGHFLALKASHHGSDNGVPTSLLNHYSPKYVVISVGIGNTYGHPHASALKKYLDLGSDVLRTDLSGTIVMDILL